MALCLSHSNSALTLRALLPTLPLGDLIFQQDIATYLHEVGHMLGLSHPVEVEDLPLDSADQIMLHTAVT